MLSTRFRRVVWANYKKQGRHGLPWRLTQDPYKILVSEVMLQQTQVERVIPFYKNFLKKFPTAKVLAAAPLADVLKAWQGLGYNRRAKLLREASQELVRTPLFSTRLNLVKELEKLPGVGPYTASAVAAFAYNQDVVFVETNIRTAIMYHFFSKKNKKGTMTYRSVSDAQILEVLEHLSPRGKSREWYSALMDYGAYLKRSGVQINKKSKHYTKQSAFTGSLREARGAILRALAEKTTSAARLANRLGPTRRLQMREAIKALTSEGLVEKTGRKLHLANV